VVEVSGPSSGLRSDAVARRPWRASRRALLAAGAVTALAGCGEEDEGAAARPSDVVLPSLAAERALAAAAGSDFPRVAARARERARRLASVVAAEGGRPHDAPAPAGGGADPVELGRAALVAHIAALPGLVDRALRQLGAEIVVGAAEDVAVMSDQSLEAFPGSIP
jgi:hypothetical protein